MRFGSSFSVMLALRKQLQQHELQQHYFETFSSKSATACASTASAATCVRFGSNTATTCASAASTATTCASAEIQRRHALRQQLQHRHVLHFPNYGRLKRRLPSHYCAHVMWLYTASVRHCAVYINREFCACLLGYTHAQTHTLTHTH